MISQALDNIALLDVPHLFYGFRGSFLRRVEKGSVVQTVRTIGEMA